MLLCNKSDANEGDKMAQVMTFENPCRRPCLLCPQRGLTRHPPTTPHHRLKFKQLPQPFPYLHEERHGDGLLKLLLLHLELAALQLQLHQV